MTVTLTTAARADEPVLQNLAQFYTHDFSEFWVGTSNGDLMADGRFEPYPLASYWTDPVRSAQFIWSDGFLAGFALVNDHAHSGVPVASSMAEFFVLRKHRGQGVGRIAAELVFSQRPGPWEVAVARRNTQALTFWRRAVQATGRAHDLVETDVSSDGWNGPILRFIWS